MRTPHLLALTLPAIVLLTVSCNKPPQVQPLQLDTLEQKASYSIGADFVTRLDAQGAEIDLDALIHGMKDAQAGKTPALSDEEMAQAIKDLQQKIQTAQLEKQKTLAAANLEAGQAFLADNADKEGVITTASGLQYKVINAGSGASPTAEDTVVTHYEGRLIDGRVFDSSYQRDQPATFPVNGVIKGWTEALQLMKVGAKWQLYIPAELAYGPSQRGPLIEPNSTLVFDIELLEINPAK